MEPGRSLPGLAAGYRRQAAGGRIKNQQPPFCGNQRGNRRLYWVDKGEIMRFIETFREGNHISDVYLCKAKQIALTKNGKEYGSLVLQDKTGTVDAKIWV